MDEAPKPNCPICGSSIALVNSSTNPVFNVETWCCLSCDYQEQVMFESKEN